MTIRGKSILNILFQEKFDLEEQIKKATEELNELQHQLEERIVSINKEEESLMVHFKPTMEVPAFSRRYF